MASQHRHAGRGRAHAYRVVPEDLVGLVDHLHLLLGVTVLEEIVDVGDHVLVDGIVVEGGIFTPNASVPLGLHLVHGGGAGTGHGLIGGHHNPLYHILPVEGSQGKKHLDGGAIGIGDDEIVFLEDIGVDLRDDKFLGRVHPPAGGVVNHPAPHLGELGGEVAGDVGPGGEQRQFRPAGNRLLGRHDRIFLPLEGDHFTHRPP